MDWWANPWAIAFMFAVAFLVMLKEWFKAHDIIDKIKKDSDEFAKEMRTEYWKRVTDLEWENQELKEKLGR